MMRMRGSAVALLLGAIARGVEAQSGGGSLVSDADASAQLTSIVSAARDAGLPTDPIVSKVQYAVRVAHAPPDRIVAAARALAGRLEIAREALAPDPTAADIAAGADALGAGVVPKDLQAIRAVSARHSVAMPLGVLAQLVSSNVPRADATAKVADLIRRGATIRQLITLGNDVNSDIAGGELATKALDVRIRGLNAVLAPGGAGAGAAAEPLDVGSHTGPKKP